MVTTIEGIHYRYRGGNCVVEFDRREEGTEDWYRCTVLVAHGPCGCDEDECRAFEGTPVHERLEAGDVTMWREVERAYQAWRAGAPHDETIAQHVPA